MITAGSRLRLRVPEGVARPLLWLSFIAIPTVVVVTALTQPNVAWDFHHELYPQAKLMLEGANPYPESGHNPATGTNLVWPPLAAYVVAPLTVLPIGTADVVAAIVGLACIYGALLIVGLRDWRVFGLVALWPPVYVELGLTHLTPAIALLAALAWRYRDSAYGSGLAAGLAVALKLFVWPMIVWVAAFKGVRAPLVAAAVAVGSLALVLPYTGIFDFADALLDVGRTFDQDAYTVFGLLVQLGAPDWLAHTATVVATALLAVATWRRQSFSLAIATALVASPIVWLDYFSLTALPLAIARPRLSWIWFVPLATVGLEGAGLAIGDAVGTTRALVTFSVVMVVAYRHESTAGVVGSSHGSRRALVGRSTRPAA